MSSNTNIDDSQKTTIIQTAYSLFDIDPSTLPVRALQKVSQSATTKKFYTEDMYKKLVYNLVCLKKEVMRSNLDNKFVEIWKAYYKENGDYLRDDKESIQDDVVIFLTKYIRKHTNITNSSFNKLFSVAPPAKTNKPTTPNSNTRNLITFSAAPAKTNIPPAQTKRNNSAEYEQLKTIEGINTYLRSTYRDRAGGGTRPVGTIARYFQAFRDYTFTEYVTMYSSGQSFDCLVHTFLTCVSSEFRELKQSDKNEFVKFFRRKFLPTTAEFQALFAKSDRETLIADPVRAKERLLGTHFLTDQDLITICSIYGISTLVFEGPQETFPARVFINNTNLGAYMDSPAYMIGNASGVHFEAVRTSDGNYTIPLSEAYKIQRIVEESSILGSIENMTDVDAIRNALSNEWPSTPSGVSADEIKDYVKGEIERAKAEYRKEEATPTRSLANAMKMTRKNYIQARMNNSENIDMFLGTGFSRKNMEDHFGELWNIYHSNRIGSTQSAGGAPRRRSRRHRKTMRRRGVRRRQQTIRYRRPRNA